jgi:nucleotide-binding universal stress UspA family protein
MEHNLKQKILVLSDLEKFSSTTLKSAVSLAKMINADIDFLYVKKPIEIIGKENQLSANRVINQEYNKIEKKIQNLVNPISKQYGVTINYSFLFGNLKNEISKYIDDKQPEIIVLGKRKSKALHFIGDQITDLVIKKHDGIILITNEHNALEPNKELSLGVLNGSEDASDFDLVNHLIDHSQKPFKSFKIVKNSNEINSRPIQSNTKMVEYVFEQNENSISNLSNYLSKNNINILCIDREKKENKNGLYQINLNIKDIISKLNVSLLITGKQKFSVQ